MLIALAGLIVGTAGTLSMAAGAYMSTKAQRDIRETKLSKIEMELENLDFEDRVRRVKDSLMRLGIDEGRASNAALSLSDSVDASKRIVEVMRPASQRRRWRAQAGQRCTLGYST